MTTSTGYDPFALYVHDDPGTIRLLKKATERTPLKYAHLLRAELFSYNLIISPQAKLVISGGLNGNWTEVAKKLRADQRFVLHTNDPRIEIPPEVTFFNKNSDWIMEIDTIIEIYFPEIWLPK